LDRVILTSTSKISLCFAPFTGSSTTDIAANLFSRKFIGIVIENQHLEINIKRKEELENLCKAKIIKKFTA
jgi:site-specific DNA-methyltransferase (adenine-specific)